MNTLYYKKNNNIYNANYNIFYINTRNCWIFLIILCRGLTFYFKTNTIKIYNINDNMFSILIEIFSLKIINYFINNINYNKIIIFLKQIIIFRILGSRNLGSWWRTQQNWVLTHDPLILSLDDGPIPIGSSAMTQVPGVPKWRAGMVPA
jgi:hypothetical protein